MSPEDAPTNSNTSRDGTFICIRFNDTTEKYGHLEDNYTQAINAIKASASSGDVTGGVQFG
jgi:hypothetical protein